MSAVPPDADASPAGAASRDGDDESNVLHDLRDDVHADWSPAPAAATTSDARDALSKEPSFFDAASALSPPLRRVTSASIHDTHKGECDALALRVSPLLLSVLD